MVPEYLLQGNLGNLTKSSELKKPKKGPINISFTLFVGRYYMWERNPMKNALKLSRMSIRDKETRDGD